MKFDKITARQLVAKLIEDTVDDDDPLTTFNRFQSDVAASRQTELDARWTYVKSKFFDDNTERSRLYRNSKSDIYIKLVKNVPNDTHTNVYVYDEQGDFIDGTIGTVPAVDLSAALDDADRQAQDMVKDYSISVYRKSF